MFWTMRAIRLVPIVLVLLLLWAPRASAAPSPVDELLAMVNAERAAAGVPPLALRADLSDLAGAWSVSMAATGVLAHNDAYFSSDVRRQIGPGARAENVAYAGDVASVHRVLMDSPPHRANLLDARMTVFGIGAVFDGRLWWVTQAFLAAPAPAPASPEPTPAPALAITVSLDPPAPTVTTTTAAPRPVVMAPPAPSTTTSITVVLALEPAEAAPPTSTVASGEDPHPRGASKLPRTGVPGAAWVALVALGMAATATSRASRAARA